MNRREFLKNILGATAALYFSAAQSKLDLIDKVSDESDWNLDNLKDGDGDTSRQIDLWNRSTTYINIEIKFGSVPNENERVCFYLNQFDKQNEVVLDKENFEFIGSIFTDGVNSQFSISLPVNIRSRYANLIVDNETSAGIYKQSESYTNLIWGD